MLRSLEPGFDYGVSDTPVIAVTRELIQPIPTTANPEPVQVTTPLVDTVTNPTYVKSTPEPVQVSMGIVQPAPAPVIPVTTSTQNDMGFLGNLFKKKPGGTLVGNILRGVASNATGGILGSGAGRIELGQTQTNKELALAQGQVVPTVGQQALQIAGTAIASTPEGQAAIQKTIWQKYKPYILGGGAIAALLVIWKLMTGRKKSRY